MRALVQGVDLAQSWDRYLRAEGDASDQRTVRATVAWLRDEFAAAARREARFGTARLVLLDTTRVGEGGDQPTLDAFIEERGLEDFSQAEQIAAYESEFGRATRRQRRRARLVARQLQALNWIEMQVAEPPRATDSVAYWLNPLLAQPLQDAGMATLAELAQRIQGGGPNWHRRVCGVGAVKAARIVEWLFTHQASLGIQLPEQGRRGPAGIPQARHALVAPATAVRPMDKFVVPPALDGRAGSNRAPSGECRIDADTDQAAIQAWLRSKRTLQDPAGAVNHTGRAYAREAERFLLWAVLQRHKALSSIDADDCRAYRAFIADPQPRNQWCGPRAPGRWSPLWRPFTGPLMPGAQRQAVAVLGSLFSFLVDQRYLAVNPWRGLSPAAAPPTRIDAGRSLSLPQWRFVQRHVALLPPTSANRRLRLAIDWLHATGLRLSELVAARLDDLVRSPADAGPPAAWWLQVRGPAGRQRELPLPDGLIETLSGYLASRGLDPDPGAPANRGAHVLGQASDRAERAPNLPAPAPHDAKAGVGAGTVYRQLKRFFGDCAARLAAQGDATGARHLAAASTHWLRHTHARHLIGSGLPLPVAQRHLGHASLATTAAYLATDTAERLQAWRAAWSAAAAKATDDAATAALPRPADGGA